MENINAKEAGLSLLLGAGVVVLTPILAGLVSGIGFMAFEIIPKYLTVGTALAAGVSAFAVSFAINKWLR
jgi:hypothetical protein